MLSTFTLTHRPRVRREDVRVVKQFEQRLLKNAVLDVPSVVNGKNVIPRDGKIAAG
jgi:hypothetical protein